MVVIRDHKTESVTVGGYKTLQILNLGCNWTYTSWSECQLDQVCNQLDQFPGLCQLQHDHIASLIRSLDSASLIMTVLQLDQVVGPKSNPLARTRSLKTINHSKTKSKSTDTGGRRRALGGSSAQLDLLEFIKCSRSLNLYTSKGGSHHQCGTTNTSWLLPTLKTPSLDKAQSCPTLIHYFSLTRSRIWESEYTTIIYAERRPTL